jgi:hypothetical protein
MKIGVRSLAELRKSRAIDDLIQHPRSVGNCATGGARMTEYQQLCALRYVSFTAFFDIFLQSGRDPFSERGGFIRRAEPDDP